MVSLCVLVGVLALIVSPALAAAGHEFKESFNGGVGHEFSDPTGIAINNATGNVYVVDKGNNRVEELNPTGTKLEAEFNGSGTAGALSEPEAIAIDNSGRTQAEDPSVGDVYVTDHNVIDKFTATGEYKGQITSGEGGVPFEELIGVAVDPKGLLWVLQENKQLDTFSDAASNALLSGHEAAPGGLKPGLAVDSEDDLYVVHSGPLHPAKLNSMGEVLMHGEQSDTTGLAVDPSSNDVYIDAENRETGSPEIQVYTQSETTPGGFIVNGPPAETFGEAQLSDRGGTALAVSYAPISGGDVYVVDSSADKVDIFTPPKVTAYAESFHFGAPGAGAGEFTEPSGVAVNDSTNSVTNPQGEDVYVVDKGNKRVEYFSAAGAPAGQFAPPPGGFHEPQAIAVDNCKNALGEPCSTSEDPSVGDVYVTDPGAGDVDKFSSTGTYLGQLRRCPGEDEQKDGVQAPCESTGHPTRGSSRYPSQASRSALQATCG